MRLVAADGSVASGRLTELRIQPPPARGDELNERERASLLALARAAMPAGSFFRGAGPDTVAKLEQFLALSPPSVVKAYRGMLLALEGAALLGHRAPLASLTGSDGLAL